jgi:hypothetical protein
MAATFLMLPAAWAYEHFGYGRVSMPKFLPYFFTVAITGLVAFVSAKILLEIDRHRDAALRLFAERRRREEGAPALASNSSESFELMPEDQWAAFKKNHAIA